jgi:4-amino-4-deoxy-L-arabinose transferase-like glycosyltransferase
MEKEKMNVLGLVGLILGIIAAVVSFVPCLGVYAIVPGLVGIILSSIGLKHVKKGMAIAGLVCSLVGTTVASYQWYVLNAAGNELTKELQKMDQPI